VQTLLPSKKERIKGRKKERRKGGRREGRKINSRIVEWSLSAHIADTKN
jgi:hypothetical protein